MKIVQSALLALTFFGPVMITSAVQAQEYDCYAPETDTQEATCTLLGRSRLAFNAVNGLDSNIDVVNARRYTRTLIIESDDMAKLMFGSASDDAILDQLDKLNFTVLQLERTKRKLQGRYPDNKGLITALNHVWSAYFHLEGLLLPGAE
jgi:hypothetical protein